MCNSKVLFGVEENSNMMSFIGYINNAAINSRYILHHTALLAAKLWTSFVGDLIYLCWTMVHMFALQVSLSIVFANCPLPVMLFSRYHGDNDACLLLVYFTVLFSILRVDKIKMAKCTRYKIM